jgi:hypothetical protein
MNVIKYLNSFVLCAVLLVISSCKDDVQVDIVTLSKYGQQFYLGEKVVMWAGVETNDLKNVQYHWECDGGSFLVPDNVFENTWVAPNLAGIYTVKVTATVGDKTSFRETKMNVTNYYLFENFDNGKNNAGFSYFLAAKATYSMNDSIAFPNKQNLNKLMLTSSNPTSTGSIYYIYPFTKGILQIPFSMFYNMGFETFPNATLSVQQRIIFNTPIENKEKPYLKEIQWNMYPAATGTTKNLSIKMLVYTPTTNTSTWTDLLSSRVSPLGSMNLNSYEDFSMSLGTDTIFHAFRNGVEVVNSDLIRTHLRANRYDNPVCSQLYFILPYNTNTWFDNFYITNDGSILTAKPN